jgi:hypothetical protein
MARTRLRETIQIDKKLAKTKQSGKGSMEDMEKFHRTIFSK